jgi:monofunctional glycosyltransferase
MAKAIKKDRRWWRITKKIIGYWFILLLVLLIYGKWFNPPITFMQLGSVLTGQGLSRNYISANSIPYQVKLALIASEDQDYPNHGGFDWDAISKALKGQSKFGLGGTSTISQQVAKNYFLWHGWGPLRYVRKVLEFPLTKAIEVLWGKKRILNCYLNICEMGKGVYGIQAAAKKYFNKNASDLSRVEAAQIIASLPNPKIYTVKPMSKYVAWKHKWILQQMENLEGNSEIQKLINNDNIKK